MRNLAVIPARAGSKGIKQKNIRLLNEKPLIYYSVSCAINTGCFDDIVITTDDEIIINYINVYFPQIHIRRRPAELANSSATLDPVIYDACVYMEEKGRYYDAVTTIQPTSPTLQPKTLKSAIENFIKSGADTTISVTESTHLEWIEKDGEIIPAYSKRLNRQWLPKKYRETGAFLAAKRESVTAESRIGKKVLIHPLDEAESIDIDSPMDWLQAQTILNRKKILIVTTGNKIIGTGHIYRMTTLADEMFGNIIKFILVNSDEKTGNILKESGWDFTEETLENIQGAAEKFSPDIIINDILDTSPEYILSLTEKGYFVVDFEDLGEGVEHASLVINALYEQSSPPPNHKFGSSYVCLNRNFMISPPSAFRDEAKTLIATFGGVDINNLSQRTLEALPGIFNKTKISKAYIILGPAYAHRALFDKKIKEIRKKTHGEITVLCDVKNMPSLMSKCDIGITSNGRTVYELASMEIPTLSIAQNDRETLHLFARYNPGIKYLGIAHTTDSKTIENEITAIANDAEKRKKMRDSIRKVDIRGGLERVKREIMDSHWKWQHKSNHKI